MQSLTMCFEIFLACILMYNVLTSKADEDKEYDVVNCRDSNIENDDQTEIGVAKLNSITKKCCTQANLECRVMSTVDENDKEMEEYVCVNLKQTWESTESSMAKMMKSLDKCCESSISVSQGNGGTEENFPKKYN